MKFETLDTYFSKYIRLLHSENGYCQCVTCKKYKAWNDIDAGHFIKRGIWETRWNEYNVHPQCRGCNRDKNKYRPSTLDDYTFYILENYGEDKLKELLNSKKRLNRRPRQNEIDEVGKIYKAKLKEIEKIKELE